MKLLNVTKLAYGLRALLFNLALLGGAAPALADTVIVAYGDSLTQGYGVNEADSFPVRLEAALKAHGVTDARVVNAGVSGDTSAGGLARLDWTLPADQPAPALVIVEFGANDMLRGLDPALTRSNLDQILARLNQRKIPVLLAGMLASPNLGSEYKQSFDAIYPALAKAHGVVLYPFFMDGVVPDPALLQGDGLHPNGKGVGVIVDRILPSVLKALGRS